MLPATIVRALTTPAFKGKTKTGRLWTVVRDERPFGATTPPAAFYRYSPDRKAEHARALLAGCRGFLHADGYAGFADLYKPEPETGVPRLTEVACWAHARRKIYDVHSETGSPAAREALERIARLFAVEADIRGRSPAERREARQRRSAPILADLKAFLDATLTGISGKSSLAGAIRYATSRWAAHPHRRRRTARKDQQRRRTRHPPAGPGPQELSVRRLRRRRPPSRDHVHAHRERPAQRRRSRGLARRRHRPHRRPSDQSRRPAAALELSAEPRSGQGCLISAARSSDHAYGDRQF